MCGTSWGSFCFLKSTGLIIFILAVYHFDFAPCLPSLSIIQIEEKTYFFPDKFPINASILPLSIHFLGNFSWPF